jgi:hypothetical protein
MQLQDVITAARDRHPAFHKTRVPNAVAARFLTDYQNELIGKAVERDKQFLAQKAAVVLSFGGNTAPGTVGAGAGDGVPGQVAADGTFSAVEETAGSLIEALVTQGEGAAVIITERAATSATANDLTCATVARTVDQDIGKILVITAGKGKDQRREILTNTATKWSVSTGADGRQWDEIPDATSMFEVVAAVFTSSEGLGVVTDLPAVTTKTGYLVKLSSSGVPFIDWTKPLVADVEDGLPLPAALAVLGGTARYSDGDTGLLTLTTQGRRYRPPNFPAVYTVGETLFFCGSKNEWDDIVSIEIDYVPIAPAFTQLTDLFLLPDKARPVLVAKLAAFMAMRVDGMPDVSIDPTAHFAQGEKLEEHFLMTLRLTRRARHIVIREGDY